MSKITNDVLTRYGTGCYGCTHMATVGVKGLKWSAQLSNVYID